MIIQIFYIIPDPKFKSKSDQNYYTEMEIEQPSKGTGEEKALWDVINSGR